MLGMIWHWEGGDKCTIQYIYEVEKTVGEIFRGIEGKSYLNNFSLVLVAIFICVTIYHATQQLPIKL